VPRRKQCSALDVSFGVASLCPPVSEASSAHALSTSSTCAVGQPRAYMLTGLSRPRFTIDTNGAHWTAAADDRGFLCRKVPSGASGEGERHSNWPLDSVSSVSAQGRPLSLVPYGLVGLHHPGFQCRPNRRWVARPSQSSGRGATVNDEPASVATTAIPAQVTFAVYGDPADPKTQSGVAKNLGDALDRRPELAVERLDTLPSRSAFLLTAARSVRRHPDRWRWAIHLSPRTIPVALTTAACPPPPCDNASAPAHNRRRRSSSSPANAR